MKKSLQEYYDELKHNLSTRSYNVLARNNLHIVRDIIPWVFGKLSFHSLKGCGDISADELSVMCEKLHEVLYKTLTETSLTSDIIVETPTEDITKSFHVPIPYKTKDNEENTVDKKLSSIQEYLLQSDLEFIKNYHSVKGEVPMFYVLQACINRFRNSDDATLVGSKSKLKSFLNNEHWLSYSVVKMQYVYSFRFRFGKMCVQEHIDREQLFSMLVLLGKRRMYVYPDSKSIVKYRQDENKDSYFDLLVSEKISHFNLKRMIKEVKRQNELSRTKDVIIPIETFFTRNIDYWDNSALPDEDTLHDLLCLIGEIIESVFGEIVNDGTIILKKTRTDYKDIIYRVLKESGHRMHMADILDAVKSHCPECGFTKPEQLRYYITNNENIIPVGKTSTFALKEWGEMVGSIRDLALKILAQQQEPALISKIAKEILTYRPDSTYRSVTTIIQQCVEKGELVEFFGDYVGLQEKKYEDKYVSVPRSFDEWLNLYKQFVEEHGWHPLSGSTGLEGYLYRWAYKLNRSDEASAEMKQRLADLMGQLSSYPRTTTEIKFLRDCESYKNFVIQYERMVELVDDPLLCTWFKKWEFEHKRLSDNRKHYFEELLSFLKEKLGSSSSPQSMVPTEIRFVRNCNTYKKFVQKKGRKVERIDDPILYTWFDNCIQKYNSLNRSQQDHFDELLQYLVDKI